MIILNGPPAPSPYLFFDNVEWGSSTAAVAAGWTNNGGVWTQAGLEGTYAVRSDSAASTVLTPRFITSGECWIYFMFRLVALANDITILTLSSGVEYKIRVGGFIRITSGTSTDDSGGTDIVVDTDYYARILYRPGSTRSDFHVHDTSGVTQRSVSKTNITASADVNKLTFKGATSSGVIIDRIRVATTNLGYLPTP